MWHPGVNEIEWLADLKPWAQDVGEQVLGYPIRWSVETSSGMHTGKRCDVRIETADGQLLFTGEAKRPDDPKGQHPLVTSEVDDAVTKAQAAGARFCFTTNFLQIAVLDAGAGLHGQPLLRLQGNPIPMVDLVYADRVGWWKSLTDSERRAAATDGLRMLFERFRDASAGAAPPLSVDHVAVDYFRALTDSLLDPLHKAFDAALPTVSSGIHERALRAGLDLSHPQQRRYLVAQGITEVLTAVLFQQVLRSYFNTIEAPLGGMTPQSPQKLRQAVVCALDEAVHISGDYKPILVVSEIAEWVLGHAPDDAMPHWWELLAFIERLDIDLVTGDILGTIFERLISPERRHDLGQHYTQPRLARTMARWGVREPDDVVLDPSFMRNFCVSRDVRRGAPRRTHVTNATREANRPRNSSLSLARTPMCQSSPSGTYWEQTTRSPHRLNSSISFIRSSPARCRLAAQRCGDIGSISVARSAVTSAATGTPRRSCSARA